MNKEGLFVSVIVPNYNHSEFLESRLDSIFRQTYQDYEIILLDDASTDGSSQLLLEYSDHSKVSHIVINEHNSGSAFKQWKKGVEKARGQLIWIAESDDLAVPEFLLNHVKLHLAHPGLALSYSDSEIIGEDGVILYNSSNQTDFPGKDKIEDSGVCKGISLICEKLIYLNVIPNASSVVFRKDLFPLNSQAFTMRHAGDWLIWTLILRNGMVGFINKKLNFFRRTQSSTRVHNTLKKKRRRITEELIIINSLKSICDNGAIKSRQKECIDRWVKIHPLKNSMDLFMLPSAAGVSTYDILRQFLKKHLSK